MRVLVTGACGKVGAHVARALRADAAFADGVYTTDLARGVYDTPDAQPASAALYW